MALGLFDHWQCHALSTRLTSQRRQPVNHARYINATCPVGEQTTMQMMSKQQPTEMLASHAHMPSWLIYPVHYEEKGNRQIGKRDAKSKSTTPQIMCISIRLIKSWKKPYLNSDLGNYQPNHRRNLVEAQNSSNPPIHVMIGSSHYLNESPLAGMRCPARLQSPIFKMGIQTQIRVRFW